MSLSEVQRRAWEIHHREGCPADGENIACWGPTLVQVQQAKTELAKEKNDGD